MPLDEVMRDTTAFGGLAIYGFIALLFLLLGSVDVFVQFAVGIILLYAVILAIRMIFFKKRPDKQKFKGWLTKLDAGSFPSMHSARSTVLAILLAQVFTQPLIRGLLVLGVLSVIVTRVMLKRHYVTDIIGGVIVGAVIGWLTLYATPFVLAIIA